MTRAERIQMARNALRESSNPAVVEAARRTLAELHEQDQHGAGISATDARKQRARQDRYSASGVTSTGLARPASRRGA
jgi:hypothetical protein